jgi:hypothetical protein
MECGDQVLRNFLNGLVIHLRGTKENPKNAMDVIKKNQSEVKQNIATKKVATGASEKPYEAKKASQPTTTNFKKKPASNSKFKDKKPARKIEIVEKIQYKNGKKKS